MIDFIYAVILLIFGIISKVPMSTTWCFVGLLAGREIMLAVRKVSAFTIRQSIFISLKDILKVTIGFIVPLILGIFANPHVRKEYIESLGN